MSEAAPILPPGIVVMGVSGSGKTTIAALLAGRLHVEFRDGDDFHPAVNVAKMAAGTPLDDADRAPWLDAIAAHLDRCRTSGRTVVVACSALRRAYRDRLRAGHADVCFVYLDGSRDVIGHRLGARLGHFMPPTLLDSQFETLEPPTPDEAAIVVPIDSDPGTIVTRIEGALVGSNTTKS